MYFLLSSSEHAFRIKETERFSRRMVPRRTHRGHVHRRVPYRPAGESIARSRRDTPAGVEQGEMKSTATPGAARCRERWPRLAEGAFDAYGTAAPQPVTRVHRPGVRATARAVISYRGRKRGAGGRQSTCRRERRRSTTSRAGWSKRPR